MRSQGATSLYLAAIFSGGATLVYELTLMRALAPAIGATWPAISVVLCGFMAGLGLGSLLGGWLADRVRPVRAYRLVELAIAAMAMALPWLAPWLEIVPVGALGRALLAGVVLLPMTTLMGSTFPLQSRALHDGTDAAGHVPWLYATNTLGAFLGAALGGLILPFALGIDLTLRGAALANLIAAGLSQLTAEPAPTQPMASARSMPATMPATMPAAGLLVLGFGSGFLVMSCEMFWTRSMLYLDPHTYSGWLTGPEEVMTIVMSLVLIGNAMGSVISARWTHQSLASSATALVWTLSAAAASSLLCLEYFAVGAMGLHHLDWMEWPAWVGPARLLPVLLPAVLLGVTFPLLARLYAGEADGHGQRMGRIWLVNTAGSVLGALGGGLLMPILGSGPGLVMTAVVALGLAAVATQWSDRRMATAALLLAGTWIISVGVFTPLGPGQWFALRYGRDAVRAEWEGWDSSTVVVDTPEGRVMGTNGRILHDGVVRERARRLQALATGAHAVLVVGFGTGSFPEEILKAPSVTSVKIVEIDPWQYQAAPWFETQAVLDDPRVEAIADDALHYIAHTDEQFDLVVVDAWGPEASPTIYAREFHERVLDRLTDDGIIWAKLSTLTPESVPPVLDAARCVYPFSAAMGSRRAPIAVMGGRGPIRAVPEMPKLTLMTGHVGACDPLSLRFPRRLQVMR